MKKLQPDTALPFLTGSGEMGELIRAKDWATTPLGAPGSWPATLKQAIAQVLINPFPMLICWGTDYIQIYNDAFRPINGLTKHPQALGGSAKDTYAEIWDTIGPMFAGVMQGQPVGFPGFKVPLNRNGYLEDCYFDFSYSPIKDENGHIHGVLVICVEVSAQIAALKILEEQNQEIAATSEEMAASNEELAAINEELLTTQTKLQQVFNELEISETKYRNEQHRLERFFMQAPAGICIFDGPGLIFELINPLYQQLFPGRELLGRPLVEAMPEVKGTPILDILNDVYKTGKTFEGKALLIPLARTSDGPVEDRYFDFIYQARLTEQNKVDGILVFVIEVTDTIIKGEKIKESAAKNAQLAAIVNSSEDTIVSKTLQGVITSWNAAAERMFGYTVDEAVGQHISLLIPPEHLNEEDYIIGQISQGNKVDHFETVRVAKGGRLIPLSLTVSPIVDEQGNIIGASKIARDISAQKEAQETAEHLYEQVKILNDKKDEFIGLASHELKTPLTSITGYLQILKRMHTDDNSMRFVDKTLRQLSKLTALVNDLLDVSKIETGKLQFTMEQFDLKPLVEDAIELIQLSTNKYIIHFDTQMESCPILADSQRIEQVLVNLLTNAIKYSPGADNVEVTLYCTEKEATVSIRDYGIGIAAGSLKHIFSRFYRVHDAPSNISGLGIGLYLSHEIIERHHGRLWTESEPGKGSTFHFSLPLGGI